MDAAVLLLLLRLLGAALLLAFLALILWFIWRDLRLTATALTQQQRVQGHLVVVANDVAEPAVGARFPLLPLTSIGRSSRNLLVLNNSYASSEHAQLTWRGNQWWLEDLDSRNGTLLNGVPLTDAAVISAGDVITIGGTELRLEP